MPGMRNVYGAERDPVAYARKARGVRAPVRVSVLSGGGDECRKLFRVGGVRGAFAVRPSELRPENGNGVEMIKTRVHTITYAYVRYRNVHVCALP